LKQFSVLSFEFSDKTNALMNVYSLNAENSKLKTQN